jgi:flavin reductase (DIM6/NTAB) family NADH-FMN oxidoreductase RutF
MDKVQLGPKTLIYPMPTLIIGSNIDGKANFMTAAWGGIANGNPPMISVAIRPQRHTLVGIKQNMSFSVNIPSVDLIKEADYCGIVSGAEVDKVDVCKFKIFYGKLESAPLIEQCPVNLECKVEHILNLGSHSLVIGQVEETHVSQDCFTDDKPDIEKINPFTFVTHPAGEYRAIGDYLAKAHSIGRELETK